MVILSWKLLNYIADTTSCAKPRKYIFHFKVEKSSENIPHFSLASQSELCVCVCVCMLKEEGRKRERERKEENILLDDITIFLIESEQPGGILGIL